MQQAFSPWESLIQTDRQRAQEVADYEIIIFNIEQSTICCLPRLKAESWAHLPESSIEVADTGWSLLLSDSGPESSASLWKWALAWKILTAVATLKC